MFSFFKRNQKKIIGGDIAYWGLGEWWLSSFSEEEREIIRTAYNPLTTGIVNIDAGEIIHSSGDPLKFLTGLVGYLNKEPTRYLAFRIIDKINDLDASTIPILSRHFAFQAICATYYRWREIDEFALTRAIEACELSISISKLAAKAFLTDPMFKMIPGHYCFKQYSIIEEKLGNFAKAINVTKQAKSEGWQGDWDRRLVRLSSKMEKQS